MISEIKQRFILMFLGDADHNFNACCAALGVRPSEAVHWFGESEFIKAKERAHMQLLRRLGYGPMLALEDMHAIAHSDITKIITDVDGKITVESLSELPRNQRIAIKSVKCAVALDKDGQAFIYPKEIVMHDKMAALSKVAEWHNVAEHEAVKGAQTAADGPKRITGMVVRPPVTIDVAEGEKLLDG